MTEINLTLRHGDTYLGRLTILSDGAAADLTNCTVKAMVKPDHLTPDASATLALIVGAGLTVIDALAGIVDLEISAGQSATLSAGKTYVWDFQVIEAGVRVFTACGGGVMTTNDVVLAIA